MPKAIIVDDEPYLRKQLKRTLIKLWPELDVIAEAGDGDSAINIINREKPDVSFLDIRMPGKDGLQVAVNVSASTHVVFTTAYDHYAVEAFEKEAFDYLLKPITEERLGKTIERLKKSLQSQPEDYTAQLTRLASELVNKPPTKLKWIRALKGEETHLIDVEYVLFFHAEDKYTTVVTEEGEYLIRKPIKELEQELDNNQFWRIHRSTIIKAAAIETSRRDISGGYQLTIKNSKRKLKVSRNYAHLFKQM